MKKLNFAVTNNGNKMTEAYESPNKAVEYREYERSNSPFGRFRGISLTLLVMCFSCLTGTQELKAQDNKFTFTEEFKPKPSVNGAAVFKGTVTVSFGRGTSMPGEMVNVYVYAKLTQENLKYLHKGKTYTSADYASISTSNYFL